MTTEQKAKAYDEALELMRDCVPDEDGLVHVRPSDIFSELRESEDERIRKEIIAILQYKYEKFSKDPKYCNAPQWIAWLEKQNNQRGQLINKACDVLVNCIEDYMLRRMEVWSEECKKQTLENIRKKLEE